MHSTRREFLLASFAGALTRAASAATTEKVTPEMFGAKGDGRTNDTAAFAALSAHANLLGGGVVVLRPVTYIVGEQSPSGTQSFSPSKILHFDRCKDAIVVRGNGATLRCAPGLRYGGFNSSGEALPTSLSNLELQNMAEPYVAMVLVQRCTGSIEISDIELDGNLGALKVGGGWTKDGWEAATYGIWLVDTDAPARISNVYSHHHAQDGLILMPIPESDGPIIVREVTCDYNARQGCTVSSGRNIMFQGCRFRHTGRAPPLYRNNPGAGVDIEAERGPIRNVRFSNCEFSDNISAGVIAGSGDSAGIRFDDCKFIGTTNLAAWPDKPGIVFNDCLFVGQIAHIHADPNPAEATQFIGCTFTDEVPTSPAAPVYLGSEGSSTAIAIMPKDLNVLFRQCHFRMVRDGLLPESHGGAIYDSCEMSQRSRAQSSPVGTYVGTNTIRGNAHLDGSSIRGNVSLNGITLPLTG